MSRSPSLPDGPADPYRTAWSAVARQLRRGLSWSGHERDCAWLGRGDGTFADASAVLGLDLDDDGRALAVVDWDLDGDLDLLRTGRGAPRVRHLRNESPPGEDWVAIWLVNSGVDRDAIGARVELELLDDSASGPRRTRVATRRAGSGYLAQSSGWLHLGLGDARPGALTVVWPDGSRERFEGLRRGRRFRAVRGEGQVRRWDPPTAVGVRPDPEPWRDPSGRPGALVLASPQPVPHLELRDARGRAARLFGVAAGATLGTGSPFVVHLWSVDCAPCARELAELAPVAGSLAQEGIEFLALCVDPEENRERAGALLERVAWPRPHAFATPETLEVLDAVHGALRDTDRRLGLPCTFLFDGRGQVVALQEGVLGPEDLRARLGLARDLSHFERLTRAVPEPGPWLVPPLPREQGGDLGAVLRRRGLVRAAEELELLAVDVRRADGADVAFEQGVARVRQGDLRRGAEQFERTLVIDPEHAGAWAGLGYCRHRMQDLVPARDAYREAVRLRPSDATSRLNLGLVLLDLGDREGAREQLAALEPLDADLARRLREMLEGR